MNIWSATPTIQDELTTLQRLECQFKASLTGEFLTMRNDIVLREEILDVCDAIAGHVQGGVIQSLDENSFIITGLYKTNPVFVWVYNNSQRKKKFSSDAIEFRIEVIGHRTCMGIHDFLDQRYGSTKCAQIKWWTQGPHGAETREVYLPPLTTQIRPEYYPDLPDPIGFLDEYMANSASVLLIAGPPGTGKTTLLRHLICAKNLCAHVIFDERLMEKDGPFQSFLFGDDPLMVIEDADIILTSRENDGNHMMARFLNVSDGLIKLPNKKLIFTTNLSDFGRVDHALIRPGRCFGILHTRAMNLKEAQAAANVAGVPVPTVQKEYTLAELFNQTNQNRVRRVGFA